MTSFNLSIKKQHIFLLRIGDLYSIYTFRTKLSLGTSTSRQVSNGDGVVLEICLDRKFEWPVQTFLFKPSSGICDPNKFRARHHRKIEFDLKSIKMNFFCFPKLVPEQLLKNGKNFLLTAKGCTWDEVVSP